MEIKVDKKLQAWENRECGLWELPINARTLQVVQNKTSLGKLNAKRDFTECLESVLWLHCVPATRSPCIPVLPKSS